MFQPANANANTSVIFKMTVIISFVRVPSAMAKSINTYQARINTIILGENYQPFPYSQCLLENYQPLVSSRGYLGIYFTDQYNINLGPNGLNVQHKRDKITPEG